VGISAEVELPGGKYEITNILIASSNWLSS
jgi:hypothetical protein